MDGCLFVGDALVVWIPSGMDKAKDVLAKAEAGSDVSIELSGGGAVSTKAERRSMWRGSG